MKYKHLGYAVTVEIIHTSDDLYVTDERVMTFCLDITDAESVFDALSIKDLYYHGCADLETIEEVTLFLEEWEFSDSSKDFSKRELKTRLLM